MVKRSSGTRRLQVFKGRGDLGGGGVLAGQAVAPADDGEVVPAPQRGAHVLVQRLAGAAGFLGAVQHRHGLHGFGQGGHEAVHVEGPEQVHLHEAHLLALRVQGVHGLLDAAGHGAHGHHHALGVGRAVVVEAVIGPAGDFADLRHVVLDDVGQGVVIGVGGLAHLEEDVRVLHGGADHRVLRVQGVVAEGVHGVHVQQRAQILIGNLLHLVDLVARAEAVEEVQEGHAPLDGGQVGHPGQVHDLLHAAGAQHGKAGLAAVHHVGVVAEYGHGVGAHRAGRHVQHPRQALAGDAVQHRDHQHKALGAGEGRRQRAGLQRAVHRRRRAGLGLHLHQPHRLAEQVLLPLGRPQVGLARHGAGGRDGVDGGDLGEGVGHVGRGLVAVEGDVGGFLLFGHLRDLLVPCSVN